MGGRPNPARENLMKINEKRSCKFAFAVGHTRLTLLSKRAPIIADLMEANAVQCMRLPFIMMTFFKAAGAGK
jgi:hypothetical protein